MLKRSQKATGRPRSLRAMIDEAAAFAERHPNLFQMMAAPRSDDQEAVSRLGHEVEECMAVRVVPRDNPEKVTVALEVRLLSQAASLPISESSCSVRRQSAADALAWTCSGLVAPAMTDATALCASR
jgi:hypothetical protein